MAVITKGYKQGRGVAFYDIEDKPHNAVHTMMPKDEVVKLISDGKVTNAKIQWWQGKPIVRVQGNILLVKIVSDASSSDTAPEVVPTVKRSQNKPVENKPEPAIRAEVVGKLSKKKNNETIYEAINKREIEEHRKAASTISYKGMDTLEDLLDSMIADFRLKNAEQYKKMVGKKIKLTQRLSSIAQTNLQSIQESFAVYLMNMSYMETRETYEKYLAVK